MGASISKISCWFFLLQTPGRIWRKLKRTDFDWSFTAWSFPTANLPSPPSGETKVGGARLAGGLEADCRAGWRAGWRRTDGQAGGRDGDGDWSDLLRQLRARRQCRAANKRGFVFQSSMCLAAGLCWLQVEMYETSMWLHSLLGTGCFYIRSDGLSCPGRLMHCSQTILTSLPQVSQVMPTPLCSPAQRFQTLPELPAR